MTDYTKEQILQHRQEWLAALRSGKYRQTTNVLKCRNGAYCCLGVAEKVAGVEPVWNGDRNEYAFNRHVVNLDKVTMTYLGLTQPSPSVAFPGTGPQPYWGASLDIDANLYPVPLVDLNDEARWPFSQIADAIEEFGFTRPSELELMWK